MYGRPKHRPLILWARIGGHRLGSQFDGLGHIGIMVGNQPRYYSGFTQEQVGGAYGLKKLGVHNVKPFFTRGILLDILALKGGGTAPDRLRHHGR